MPIAVRSCSFTSSYDNSMLFSEFQYCLNWNMQVSNSTMHSLKRQKAGSTTPDSKYATEHLNQTQLIEEMKQLRQKIWQYHLRQNVHTPIHFLDKSENVLSCDRQVHPIRQGKLKNFHAIELIIIERRRRMEKWVSYTKVKGEVPSGGTLGVVLSKNSEKVLSTTDK